ncbi:hypothetical protein B9G69_006865 [Bdellovibrio sp. SKB1291214]|uniref:hypothetical protein n=1 Tax=Bdellovibrio sp. SKB1291214 TaxID=1732569 RepID=UPI000B516E52|nr:hypothetical protein [Bdellovibrio sp. SKB1291214]UYL10299.1 hypothetical protein B9G69_006865 [Bdellovibrio sp. SKB1291214]
MKMIIAALMLVSSSAMASAVDDSINIKVLSYCSANKVVTENDGQVVVKQDCDALNKECVDTVSSRMGGKFVNYTASCEDKK